MAAALKATIRGARVTLIELRTIGGTCVNIGIKAFIVEGKAVVRDLARQAATVLRRLGTVSLKNKLYFAFRKLRRVVRKT